MDTLDSMQLALSHAVEVAPLIKRLPTDEALRKLAAVKEEMEPFPGIGVLKPGRIHFGAVVAWHCVPFISTLQ